MGAEQTGLPGLQWRQSPPVESAGMIAQPLHLPEAAVLG